MPIVKNINGNTYRVPELGSTGWGVYTTEFLVALVDAALTTGAGDTKPLVAELDLGDVFGVQTVYVKSNQSNPAAAGVVRLANGDTISWRKQDNSGDIAIKVNASDRLEVGGVVIPTISSSDALINKTIDVDNNTVSNIELDNLKSGVLDTDLSSVSASDDTIPSAKATKAALDLKINTSVLDIDGTLAANSDAVIATQKAVKTYVDTHINDTTDAHAASAISVAAGITNLAATDVQAALEEIQGDVDGRMVAFGSTTDNRLVKSTTFLNAVEQTGISVDDSNNVSGAANVLASGVVGKSATSQLNIPAGTEGQRTTGVQGDIRYNTTAAAFEGHNGSVWKGLGGGGLIPVTITVSGSTPSIATLESGKHYIVDMSTATGDVALTAPAAVAEANFKVSVLKNFTNAWRVTINRAGSDNFYYVNQTDTAIRLYNPESWAEFFYLSSALWGLNTDESGSGGSSGGSGEKNYIANPSGLGDTTGWAASAGTLTVGRTTTAANLPREFTTAAALSFASSTDEIYGRYRFSLDDADISKKLKIEMAIKNAGTSTSWRVEMWKNSASDYSGTYTELSLSTDASGDSYLPVTTGVYKTTFDTDTTQYLELRIVHNGTASETLYISDIIVGPGSVVQGAVVEAPKTVVVTGSWSTNTTYTAKETRIGTLARYEVYLSMAGAPDSTALTINLPSGRTIDTTALLNQYASGILGIGAARDSGTTAYPLTVGYNSTTSVKIFAVNTDSTYATNVNAVAQNLPIATIVNGDQFYFDFTVPIAEWAGSGTVNLAQNDVEYAASTTGTWDAAAAAANTVYSPNGAPISGALTTTRSKVVQFQQPIQVSSDRISLEFYHPSRGWIESQYSYQGNMVEWPNAEFGAQMSVTASNQVTVLFYQYGSPGATYNNATGTNWSTSFVQAWRVRKTSAGACVGFGLATSTSTGLVTREVTGSFTATTSTSGSGGTSVAQSLTWYYSRVGNIVTIELANVTVGMVKNASTGSVLVSGLPSFITPTTAVFGSTASVMYTASTLYNAKTRINTDGTIDFYRDGQGNSVGANAAYEWFPCTITYAIR